MMKKVWMVLLAIMLVFGLVLLGCPGGGGDDDDDDDDDEVDITWTVSQEGGTAGTADSAFIVIAFSDEVADFTAANVELEGDDGDAEIDEDEDFVASGNNWKIPIIVNDPGVVNVTLTGLTGVELGTKTVSVFKAGVVADVNYTVAADGVAGFAVSTEITFVFTEAVTGLTAADITLADDTGKATKGALTGSGTAWKLAITVVEAGSIKVSIDKDGIVSSIKDVVVYDLFPAFNIPADGVLFENGEWAEGLGAVTVTGVDSGVVVELEDDVYAAPGEHLEFNFSNIMDMSDYTKLVIEITGDFDASDNNKNYWGGGALFYVDGEGFEGEDEDEIEYVVKFGFWGGINSTPFTNNPPKAVFTFDIELFDTECGEADCTVAGCGEDDDNPGTYGHPHELDAGPDGAEFDDYIESFVGFVVGAAFGKSDWSGASWSVTKIYFEE